MEAWIALLPTATVGVAYGCLSVDALRAKVAFELISPSPDQLTGFPTRRQCHSVMERNLGQGAAGAAVLCDVDDLRGFNSTFGYVIADQALQAVARSLTSALTGRAGRNNVDRDGVFRLGGDEFLIFLRWSDAGTAVALAKHARSEVKGATADLVGLSLERRTLTARFAVTAWAASLRRAAGRPRRRAGQRGAGRRCSHWSEREVAPAAIRRVTRSGRLTDTEPPAPWCHARGILSGGLWVDVTRRAVASLALCC
jgi:diguanylate cyclase (GGDEF)-like protein